MTAKIKLICTHAEKTSGGVVQTPHAFSAEPAANEGGLLKVGGNGVLLDGDAAETTDDHTPKAGDFVALPSKKAVLKAAQSVLTVCGKPVITRAGQVRVCCEAAPERALAAAETSGGSDLLSVETSPVLTGS